MKLSMVGAVFPKAMHHRDKVLTRNILISLAVKGLSIVIGFLTMPVYLKYFSSQEVLGVWLTIVSMLSWIITFDLGIGNGLRNQLAIAIAKEDLVRAKAVLSSSYILIGALCLVLMSMMFFAIPLINWNALFNIRAEILPRATLTRVITILSVGLLLQFFLALVNSVYLALQKAALPSFLVLVTNTCLLLFMYYSHPGGLSKNIVFISWVYSFAITTPLLGANLLVFKRSLRSCRPGIDAFDLHLSMDLLKLGGAFLFLQITAMIIFNTNNILISHLVGPSAVVQYAIYFKLFGLVSMFFVLGIGPVWSAVTDASARNDFQWVLKTQRRLFGFLGLGLIGEIFIFTICHRVVALWMGVGFRPAGSGLILSIAVADILFIAANINSSIGNGLGKLRLQIVLVGIGALINIPIAIGLSRIYHNAASIVFANIVSLTPYCIAEYFSTKRFLNVKIARLSTNVF